MKIAEEHLKISLKRPNVARTKKYQDMSWIQNSPNQV